MTLDGYLVGCRSGGLVQALRGWLKQSEDACSGVRIEIANGITMLPQNQFNLPGRAISPMDPNYLEGKAQGVAPLTEVDILSDDGIPVLTCIIPDHIVACPVQSNVVDVDRAWVEK